jgi:hypothetical protein
MDAVVISKDGLLRSRSFSAEEAAGKWIVLAHVIESRLVSGRLQTNRSTPVHAGTLYSIVSQAQVVLLGTIVQSTAKWRLGERYPVVFGLLCERIPQSYPYRLLGAL